MTVAERIYKNSDRGFLSLKECVKVWTLTPGKAPILIIQKHMFIDGSILTLRHYWFGNKELWQVEK
jgi:hypothetical protein